MTDFPNARKSTDSVMGWESPLAKTEEFILLSEGHYRFKVVHFEKDFYEDDSTSCPVANLRLEIDNEHGNVVINQKLFLTEGNIQMISDFFASIGMTAEAVSLYDTPKVRKKLKTNFGRKISSYTSLANWYFRNRHKKVFLPEFKLNGNLQHRKTSDYAAINGRSMARVMKGGEDYKKPKVFRSCCSLCLDSDRLC